MQPEYNYWVFHKEHRSPIWPYFQLNSPYNCRANLSVLESSCYASEILSATGSRVACVADRQNRRYSNTGDFVTRPAATQARSRGVLFDLISS